jgi:hypothetical protein
MRQEEQKERHAGGQRQVRRMDRDRDRRRDRRKTGAGGGKGWRQKEGQKDRDRRKTGTEGGTGTGTEERQKEEQEDGDKRKTGTGGGTGGQEDRRAGAGQKRAPALSQPLAGACPRPRALRGPISGTGTAKRAMLPRSLARGPGGRGAEGGAESRYLGSGRTILLLARAAGAALLFSMAIR